MPSPCRRGRATTSTTCCCAKGRRPSGDAIQAALDGDSAGDADRPAETGRHLPIGFVEPSGSLPALRADEGDLARAVDRAWAVLLASNRSPWLFRSGGQPSWVTPDDEGRPVVAPVTEERLRLMLAKLAEWQRTNRNGDLVPAPPPMALVKSLLATPDPRLPVLAGIVATPVFGRSGTLLTEPGYHPDARLLYHPAPGFQLPPVPERPTAAADRRGALAAPGRPARGFPVRLGGRAGARRRPAAARLRAAPWSTARRRCT